MIAQCGTGKGGKTTKSRSCETAVVPPENSACDAVAHIPCDSNAIKIDSGKSLLTTTTTTPRYQTDTCVLQKEDCVFGPVCAIWGTALVSKCEDNW